MSDFRDKLEKALLAQGAAVQYIESTFGSSRTYWFSKGFRFGLGLMSIVAFKKLRYITVPLTAAEFLLSYGYLIAAEVKDKVDRKS